MSYTLFVIFGFSISIAAVIGWVRVRKIDSAYFPFLYILWIGLATEIISYIVTHHGHSNSVLYNIYVLIEAILITWQFRRWQLFDRAKFLFVGLLASYAIFWSVECFYFQKIFVTASYFRLYYSAIIVLMSINVLNVQLMRESRNMFKDPVFLICIAFIIYYIYKVIVGIFRVWGLAASYSFEVHLDLIMPYVNLFANLIFALAVLWMPKKHRFLLQY
jgi:hypothetical protein